MRWPAASLVGSSLMLYKAPTPLTISGRPVGLSEQRISIATRWAGGWWSSSAKYSGLWRFTGLGVQIPRLTNRYYTTCLVVHPGGFVCEELLVVSLGRQLPPPRELLLLCFYYTLDLLGNLMLSRSWPLMLSNRSTLNCWVCPSAGKPRGAQCCRRPIGYFGHPWDVGCHRQLCFTRAS